jgi:hypothetical protein
MVFVTEESITELCKLKKEKEKERKKKEKNDDELEQGKIFFKQGIQIHETMNARYGPGIWLTSQKKITVELWSLGFALASSEASAVDAARSSSFKFRSLAFKNKHISLKLCQAKCQQKL